MKFFAGIVTAIIIMAGAAALLAWTYDVAASVPETAVEFEILHSIMRNSVQMRAGTEERKTWSEQDVSNGFKDYDEMCIICHSAPGKERRPISKGMRPQPPNLAETSKQWTNAQLFWLIKNGVKMTGMPGFGSTHSDEQIWNIVGFVRLCRKSHRMTSARWRVNLEAPASTKKMVIINKTETRAIPTLG